MNKEREIRHGDRISALGHSFTVDRILYQEYCGDRATAGASDWWGYDVEFIDPAGNYHHWKQNQDHGTAERWNGRYWSVFGDDGSLIAGASITIHWTEPDGTPGYAATIYTGTNDDGDHTFRSMVYGWTYTLDRFLREIRHQSYPDDVLRADNSTGWMRYLP